MNRQRMSLQERYGLLNQIVDPIQRSLWWDIYSYLDETAVDLSLIHRAVGFGRWLGPVAVAVIIFVAGRAF